MSHTNARNKTKLVCTIGPATDSEEIIIQLLLAGMNIARLNFSQGEFSWHQKTIEKLRSAGRIAGKQVTILADMPGPKLRIGKLACEMIILKQGDAFCLTTQDILGNQQGVGINFPRLLELVKPGDRLFLNDGMIELEVGVVKNQDIHCQVRVGGDLRSHKGLNLPGIDLGISAFTEHDRICLKVALQCSVDAVSQSFVETAADVTDLRKAANDLGYNPFIIAKIERARALNCIDEILQAADGIMVARGDLGVETPLEGLAMIQKQLIKRAKFFGKPVIIATQMLASMVDHYRPTRAEATDVASALIYADAKRRAASTILSNNRRGQSGLWSYGVSGDVPLVLITIHDARNMSLVKKLLQAHAYWRIKGLVIELRPMAFIAAVLKSVNFYVTDAAFTLYPQSGAASYRGDSPRYQASLCHFCTSSRRFALRLPPDRSDRKIFS